VRATEDVEAVEQQRRTSGKMSYKHDEVSALGDSADDHAQADNNKAGSPPPFVRDGRKIGRNEPCPCGSGKKFKQCHGKLS